MIVEISQDPYPLSFELKKSYRVFESKKSTSWDLDISDG
jgi:hypothetical protein